MINQRATSIQYSSLWYLVTTIFIIFVPSQMLYGSPAWKLSGENGRFIIGLALAHLLVGAVAVMRARFANTSRLSEAITIGTAILGSYALLLLLTKSYPDRILLLVGLTIFGSFLLLFNFLALRCQKLALIFIGFTVIFILLLGKRIQHSIPGGSDDIAASKVSAKIVDSAYHTIDMTFYDKFFDDCTSGDETCEASRPGGAILVFAHGYLGTLGNGQMHFFSRNSSTNALSRRMLPYRAPLNTDDFVRDAGDKSIARFRVTGAVIQKRSDSFRLFLVHHHWKSDQKCFVTRVSSTESEYEKFLSGTATVNWTTVYESYPCLKHTGGTFYGDESGGRVALKDDGTLILTIGDYSRDGMTGDPPLAQDVNNTYGKIIQIDLRTGEGTTLSLGHRNPQGLHIDEQGTIWETEHGPRGGDELNIISKDLNYGWPFVTYGTHMLSHSWPLNADQGEHNGFQLPILAWVPSTAISNLIRVRGDLFDRWKGDLLIGSYKKTLWRVRVREGRVIYAEPIEIRDKNARIRDILEDEDGRIVLLLDGGSIAVLKPTSEDKRVPDGIAGSDSMRGQLLFTQCRSCHEVKDGSTHGIGPDLAGIVGKPIGRGSNYSYSSVLSKMSDTWSVDNLDKFLENPQQFAKGTSMTFGGIPSSSDRAKLIEFLKTQ